MYKESGVIRYLDRIDTLIPNTNVWSKLQCEIAAAEYSYNKNMTCYHLGTKVLVVDCSKMKINEKFYAKIEAIKKFSEKNAIITQVTK